MTVVMAFSSHRTVNCCVHFLSIHNCVNVSVKTLNLSALCNCVQQFSGMCTDD